MIRSLILYLLKTSNWSCTYCAYIRLVTKTRTGTVFTVTLNFEKTIKVLISQIGVDAPTHEMTNGFLFFRWLPYSLWSWSWRTTSKSRPSSSISYPKPSVSQRLSAKSQRVFSAERICNRNRQPRLMRVGFHFQCKSSWPSTCSWQYLYPVCYWPGFLW